MGQKPQYRVRNWRDYNEALVQRGSVTFWFNEESISQWESKKPIGKRGRPQEYSNVAIQTGLVIKALFKLTFRGTQGFIKSLMSLLKTGLKVPDYTLLCKRQKTVRVDLGAVRRSENIHLVVDTTGIKVFGEGEWKVRQHGWVKHRLWRKLHLAVNGHTQQIEAFELTDLGVQDCQGFPLLIKQINSPIETAKADGSYDRFSCYECAEENNFCLVTPPQKNAKKSTERKNKVDGRVSSNALKKRDEVVTKVRTLGRKEWKVQSGYHRRSLAETAMFRVKTLLGNRLSTRTLENQRAEMAIWCYVVNKMTTLGMPKTVVI